MAIKLTNDDFVLPLGNLDYAARDAVERYEPFFEAIALDRYAFQREAIRRALGFLLSASYADTSVLASEHFTASAKMQGHFGAQSAYLAKFPLADRKAVSLDVATGAGKSFVMYGIARAALAMGFVDKVLVLCPSLTIEEGLKDKFRELSARQDLKQIMESLGAVYPNPPIKTANDPILEGEICIENIHAVYDRTGSSIADSFKGKGRRTLVLNDEAHHIHSGADAGTKRWMDFLRSDDYGFRFIVGVSGTPYIGNDYFPDVIYRYGLKRAIDERVVKTPDYVTERLVEGGTSYPQIFENHRRNREKYGSKVKPVSIIVTEKIVACVRVWDELVKQLVQRQGLSRAEAEKRVIWVASGIPSGADGTEVTRLVPKPEAVRKQNMQLLRTVGSNDNPVEWIVSVSMLTEGWDVPNVFQIVPWETKAFNSKLLIAQVLGRGLRMPPGLAQPVLLTVENHEAWTQSLKNLFYEVLEIENRVSSDVVRPTFTFPLFNLTYVTEQVTEQTSAKRAREPSTVDYSPQARQLTQQTTYALSGSRAIVLEVPDLMKIDDAIARIRMFLDDKDEKIAADWPNKRIRSFITNSLNQAGQPEDFLSKENLTKTQNAFGPMFRVLGATVPRQKLKPNALVLLDPVTMPAQWVSEDQLRSNTSVYYTDDAADGFKGPDQRQLWEDWLAKRAFAKSSYIEEIAHLPDALRPQPAASFKCPTNLLVSRFKPERAFIDGMFANGELFDAFFKNADAGFYSFPYSYKPSEKASTHAKTENFNPDFLLKLAARDVVLVVEIKADNDDSSRNKAKARDAKAHFRELNAQLKDDGMAWRYYFYFLSEVDYATFFSAIREDRLDYKSSLMTRLEAAG
ncbi:MAG: DEAD/DEAH box helicase [Lysobacter sp.]